MNSPEHCNTTPPENPAHTAATILYGEHKREIALKLADIEDRFPSATEQTHHIARIIQECPTADLTRVTTEPQA